MGGGRDGDCEEGASVASVGWEPSYEFCEVASPVSLDEFWEFFEFWKFCKLRVLRMMEFFGCWGLYGVFFNGRVSEWLR